MHCIQSVYGRFVLALVILVSSVSPCVYAAEEDAPDFNQQIAPILVRRCLECHQDRDPSGELVLSSKMGLMAGGESGAVVVAGDAHKSELIERIMAGEMPPDEKGISQKLPEDEIALLRRWVQSGAAWPEDRRVSGQHRGTLGSAG